MKQTVRLKKLREDAIIPAYGTEFAAGADLYACMDKDITINPGCTEFIHTGIALEIPTGLVGLIYARSGMACKRGLPQFAKDRGYSDKDSFVEKYGKDKIVKNMIIQKAQDIVMDNAVYKQASASKALAVCIK